MPARAVRTRPDGDSRRLRPQDGEPDSRVGQPRFLPPASTPPSGPDEHDRPVERGPASRRIGQRGAPAAPSDAEVGHGRHSGNVVRRHCIAAWRAIAHRRRRGGRPGRAPPHDRPLGHERHDPIDAKLGQLLHHQLRALPLHQGERHRDRGVRRGSPTIAPATSRSPSAEAARAPPPPPRPRHGDGPGARRSTAGGGARRRRRGPARRGRRRTRGAARTAGPHRPGTRPAPASTAT